MPIDRRWIDVELEPAGMLPLTSDDRAFGAEFPDDLLIPKSEWKDRIQDQIDNDDSGGPHPRGCIVANYATNEDTVFNQHPESSCFPAGTRIRMADGSNRPIDKLHLGERVLTAERNVGRITHLMLRRNDDRLITLKLFGHPGLRMTPEHPVLTDDGYVEASNIRSGQYVALPRFIPMSSRVLQTTPHIEHARRHFSSREAYGKFKFTPGRNTAKSAAIYTKKPVHDLIDLDAAAGRIFGLFLAEGSTNKGNVSWTFHIDEEETLAAELIGLLDSQWGLEARLQRRACNRQCKVNVAGTQWARLFESLCGSGGPGRKRPHRDLLAGSPEFLEAMLFGWLDGDGCEAANDKWQGVTVSRDLALSMYDIAQALGFNPTLQHCQPKVSHGVKSRLPRWDVLFKKSPKAEHESGGRFYRREDSHVWRRVRSVTAERHVGDVYNFEVEGDNSYVAEGIGVHNCVYNSAAGCIMRRWNIQLGIEHQVILSPMSGYGVVARSRHSGSYMWEALSQVRDVGLLPSSDHGQSSQYEHTLHENTPFTRPSRFPRGWEDTAPHFRCLEWLRIDSLEQFASALLNQYPVCYGRSGHSICGEDLVLDGRKYYCRSCDSYGYRNRDGTGRIYDSERMMATGGAWACRVVTMPDSVE